MLLLVADENFNNDILRGLLRRDPSLDIVRIQDVGLTRAPDSVVLEWAVQENRVLLTHDRNTITKFAYQRVMEVDRSVPIKIAIDDILLLAVASDTGQWQGQIVYLP